tara:strand:+ start:126 stop:1199 length:1074 start_codon:yes stop_codon:yes gene_type:complete
MSYYYNDVMEYIFRHGKPYWFSTYSYEDKHCGIGLGTFWIRFENHDIKCVKQIATDMKGPEKHEIILSTFTENKHFLPKFVEFIHTEMSKEIKTDITIYEFDARMAHWRKSRKRLQRDMNSVIITNKIHETFIDDIEQFCSKSTKEWYNKFCIPYKKCYLLEGPPGTGKSSLIIAIATQLNKNVCFLQIAIKGMCDQLLQQALNDLPKDAIVVMEDIDSIFDTISGKKEQVSVTFSGLLNALDGIGDAKGRIVIMTTNNIKSLHSSLIRPGRVDQCIHVGFANNYQLKKMFARFYDDATDEETQQFCTNVREIIQQDITTAELQKFFINNRNNAKEIAIKAGNIQICLQDRTHIGYE